MSCLTIQSGTVSVQNLCHFTYLEIGVMRKALLDDVQNLRHFTYNRSSDISNYSLVHLTHIVTLTAPYSTIERIPLFNTI